MAISLTGVLRDARYPIFGVPPTAWSGPAFVGTVTRAAGAVRSVELIYLDSIDETTMGLAVGSIEGGAVASNLVDPLEAHLTSFTSHFDPAFVMARMRGRRPVPFPPSDFGRVELTVSALGATTGAALLTHKELPLQLLRLALRGRTGAADVGIAGWRIDVKPYVDALRAVDLAFAKDFEMREALASPGWDDEPPR